MPTLLSPGVCLFPSKECKLLTQPVTLPPPCCSWHVQPSLHSIAQSGLQSQGVQDVQQCLLCLVHPLLWQPAMLQDVSQPLVQIRCYTGISLFTEFAGAPLQLVQIHFYNPFLEYSASSSFSSSQKMLNFAPSFLSAVYNPPCWLVTLTTVRNGVISNNDERLSKM